MADLASTQGSLPQVSFESGALQEAVRHTEDTTATCRSHETGASSLSSGSHPPRAEEVERDGASSYPPSARIDPEAEATSSVAHLVDSSSAVVTACEERAAAALEVQDRAGQSGPPLLQDRVLFAALPAPGETGRSQTGLLLYFYTVIIWPSERRAGRRLDL